MRVVFGRAFCYDFKFVAVFFKSGVWVFFFAHFCLFVVGDRLNECSDVFRLGAW